MSTHVEWNNARDVHIHILEPGDPVAAASVVEGHAITIEGGGAVHILEGTRHELADLLTRAARALLDT